MEAHPASSSAELRALSEQAMIDAEVAKTNLEAARRRLHDLAGRAGLGARPTTAPPGTDPPGTDPPGTDPPGVSSTGSSRPVSGDDPNLN